MVKKLTQDLARKLRDRRNLRPADRANLDYKMAKKLKSGLDELAGLLYIMEALPPDKIRPSRDRKDGLKDGHIRLLLKVTESALRILDYKKVRGSAYDLYVLEEINKKITGVDWKTGKPIKHGEFHRRKAKKEELDRATLLWKHVDYLNENFVPEINTENPSICGSISIEDRIDEQIWQKEEEKIKKLLASGIRDIGQIAKEVDRDSWDMLQIIYNIQETERDTKRRKEMYAKEITNLECDSAAIERIMVLWVEGWRNNTAIAVEINHPRNAVIAIINKMIANGEIQKEDVVLVPGGGFPKPNEIDLLKYQEATRSVEHLMTRREEPQ
jgi:hypothetical protein